MLVDNYAVTQNCFNLKVIVMDMKLGPCRECWLTWQEPSFYDVLVFHCFQVSLNVFFGKPGPWFEDCELDGDKNSIFHDIDGSVTGYKDAYVGRIDNYLIRHPSCVNVTKWNAVVCSGNYAQVGQNAL